MKERFVWLLLLLLLLFGLGANAQTPVMFPLRDLTGNDQVRSITITPLDPPIVFNGTIYYSAPLTMQPFPGGATNSLGQAVSGCQTNLIGGNFRLTFAGLPRSIQLYVPFGMTNVISAADPNYWRTGIYQVFNITNAPVFNLVNSSNLPPSGIAQAGATNGQIVVWNGSAWSVENLGVPPEFLVTNANGTLGIVKTVQNANLVYAGPSSGLPGLPGFRLLVAADFGTGVPASTNILHGGLVWSPVSSNDFGADAVTYIRSLAGQGAATNLSPWLTPINANGFFLYGLSGLTNSGNIQTASINVTGAAAAASFNGPLIGAASSSTNAQAAGVATNGPPSGLFTSSLTNSGAMQTATEVVSGSSTAGIYNGPLNGNASSATTSQSANTATFATTASTATNGPNTGFFTVGQTNTGNIQSGTMNSTASIKAGTFLDTPKLENSGGPLSAVSDLFLSPAPLFSGQTTPLWFGNPGSFTNALILSLSPGSPISIYAGTNLSGIVSGGTPPHFDFANGIAYGNLGGGSNLPVAGILPAGTQGQVVTVNNGSAIWSNAPSAQLTPWPTDINGNGKSLTNVQNLISISLTAQTATVASLFSSGLTNSGTLQTANEIVTGTSTAASYNGPLNGNATSASTAVSANSAGIASTAGIATNGPSSGFFSSSSTNSGATQTGSLVVGAGGETVTGARVAVGGDSSRGSGANSEAYGSAATASGFGSTAVGNSANASGATATGIGKSANATATNSLAAGENSSATAGYGTALGGDSSASATNTTAVGGLANASGRFSSAIGSQSVASKDGSSAMGFGASASGTNATAMGYQASATHSFSTVIGQGATSTHANQVTLGTVAEETFVPGPLKVADFAVFSSNGPPTLIELGPGGVGTWNSNGILYAIGATLDGTGYAWTNDLHQQFQNISPLAADVNGNQKSITNLLAVSATTFNGGLNGNASTASSAATAGSANFASTAGIATNGPSTGFNSSSQTNSGNIQTASENVTGTITAATVASTGQVRVGTYAILSSNGPPSLVDLGPGGVGTWNSNGILYMVGAKPDGSGYAWTNDLHQTLQNQTPLAQDINGNQKNITNLTSVTAGTFSGNLNGNAATASSAASAGVANAASTAGIGTNGPSSGFFTSTSTNSGAFQTATEVVTGSSTAASYNGPLNGTATSATAAVTAGIATNGPSSGFFTSTSTNSGAFQTGTEVVTGGSKIAGGITSAGGGVNSEVYGSAANASGAGATAAGNAAVASNSGSTALGRGANVAGQNGTGIGENSTASATYATAVGGDTIAAGANSTAIGGLATTADTNTTAIGSQSGASKSGASALGYGATATGTNASAIGKAAAATHDFSTSIGAGSASTKTHQITLGTVNEEVFAPGPLRAGYNLNLTGTNVPNLATLGPFGIGTWNDNGTLWDMVANSAGSAYTITNLLGLAPLLSTYTPRSNGTVYFAAPFGSSANSGLTTNAPWPFLYAITNAGPGSTIVLMPGIYTNTALLSLPQESGLTISSLVKWGAQLIGSPGFQTFIVEPGVTNITLDGLQIGPSYIDCVKFYSATNAVIRNCWIHDAAHGDPAWVTNSTGTYVGNGILAERVVGILVENCLIENNGANVSQDQGIYVDGTNGVVRNCIVRNNFATGVQVADSAAGGVSTNWMVYDNLIYGNFNAPGNNGACQVLFFGAISGGSTPNNYFFGNTVISTNQAYAILCEYGCQLNMSNNIIVSPYTGGNGVVLAQLGGAAVLADYNATTNVFGTGGVTAGSHQLVTSYPALGFVNPNSGLYWLSAASACRGVALSTAFGTNDFFGRAQSSVADIGAFQYSKALETDKRVLQGIPLTPYGVWQDYWSIVPFDPGFYIPTQGGKGNLNTFTNPAIAGSMAYAPSATSALSPNTLGVGSKAFSTDCITPSGNGSEVWWDGSNWRLVGYNVKATADIPTFIQNSVEAANQYMSRVSDFRIETEEVQPNGLNFSRNTNQNGTGAGIGNIAFNTPFGSYGYLTPGTTSGGWSIAWGENVPPIGSGIYYGCGGAYYLSALVASGDSYFAYVGMNSVGSTQVYPTDGVFFMYDPSTNNIGAFISGISAGSRGLTNNWIAMTAAASVYSFQDTGLPASILNSAPNRLGCVLTNGAALFYTNGVLSNVIATNVPSTANGQFLNKVSIVKTAGTTQRNIGESTPWRFFRHAARTFP